MRHETTGNSKNGKVFGFALCATLFALCFPAHAQQTKKIPRIGILTPDSISVRAHSFEAFRQRLRELGYVEEKSIAFEWRSAEGMLDRLSVLAAELVSLKVDVIVASTTRAAQAAKQTSAITPIVMVVGADPVALGLIASLARPGGNITGLTNISPELSGKRLELLKEVVPKLSLVTVLWNPTAPGSVVSLKQTEDTARSLGVKLQSVEVRNSSELANAFTAATRERSGALIVQQTTVSNVHRKQLVDLAAKNRLPAMYPETESVQGGGLMSYAANSFDQWRRTAVYVDKILKGRAPADLPVEQPTKFELVINLKTAKQIGVTIPQAVLYRADRVIR
jgi:putative tryptophan/tyrosine transport system substrate-binding protein